MKIFNPNAIYQNKFSSAILIVVLSFLVSADSCNPFDELIVQVILTVDNTTDDVSRSGCRDDVPDDCSLRGAIQRAMNGTESTGIVFSSYFNSPQTITLGGSPLFIRKLLYIRGPGANLLTISGNNQSRVFEIHGAPGSLQNLATPVLISDVTITGGNAGSNGKGGAILTTRESSIPVWLTLQRTLITGNTANEGGAIFNNERLALIESTVSNNIAGGDGGAIFNRGDLVIQSSTISGNRVSSNGNQKGCGISTNQSEYENVFSKLRIRNSTITDNRCGTSVSTFNPGVSVNDGEAEIGGTIIAGNAFIIGNAVPDIQLNGGSLVSAGYNLIGNRGTVTAFDQTGDQTGTAAAPINAKLEPLGNYNGTTPTHRLFSDSPAIDKGKNFSVDLNFVVIDPKTDQRGLTKPYNNPLIAPADDGDNSDIGAVELQATTGVPNSPDLQPDNDSGASAEDNITNAASPAFEITNTVNNGFVELLRGNTVVASATATGEAAVLTDVNAPPGIFEYKSRQTANGETFISAAALITIDRTAPIVQSSVRNGINPVVSGSFVNFNVTFSEIVTNVFPSDTSLTTTGVSGASVINAAGTTNVRSVLVSTGGGAGTIKLNLVDADAITDLAGNPLGGAGAGNGDFNGGESFTVAAPTTANTRTVTKAEDSNDGVCNSDCSLREAVATVPDGGVIEFSGFFNQPRTIAYGNFNLRGIEINKNLTINGTGADRLTISGSDFNRVFTIYGGTVHLKGMTITGGNTAVLNEDSPAINSGGIMTIENCHITGNSTPRGSGAISNGGIMTIINSTISNNTVNQPGSAAGGIKTFGALNLINSTVSGNRSLGNNNFAENTGGVFVSTTTSPVAIVNSTIAGNTVESETVSAAGLLRVNAPDSSNVTIRNSIIAANINNTLKSDVRGRFTSQGYNIIGSIGTGSGFDRISDKIGNALQVFDPLLAPLGNYGGLTPTHAVSSNSPAVNAAAPANALATDQRGISRTVGGRADIGAFEVNFSFSNSPTGAGGNGTLPNAQVNQNYTVQISAASLTNLLDFASKSNSPVNDFLLSPFTYTIVDGALPQGLSLNSGTGILTGAATQNGTFYFTVKATDAADNFSGVQAYILIVNAPTAASVSISGRVLTPDGHGLQNARLTLTDVYGNTRTAAASSFGYYRFEDIAAGETYVVSIQSRRYQFTPQIVNVASQIENLDFIGQSLSQRH